MKHTRYILSLFFLSLFVISCTKKDESYQRVGFAFDTVCSIQVFARESEERVNTILDKAFEKLEKLEYVFSPTLKDSELSKFNESLVGVPIKLSDELHYVLEENLKMAKETKGAFNPCLGKITNLWRPLWQEINDEDNKISLPSKEDIENALQFVDYASIELKDKTAIKMQDVKLDFGASAKGYATDCIKTILLKEGIERAIIDLGGNIAVLDKKENGDLWKVGIKMPIPYSQGKVAGCLETFNKAIVSSGNYERFIEVDGKTYHHIISPKTGMPVDNELRAVTVVSSNAMLADILSTTCFILGQEKAKELLQKFHKSFCIFFLKDGSVIEINGKENGFSMVFNIMDDSLKKIKD